VDFSSRDKTFTGKIKGNPDIVLTKKIKMDDIFYLTTPQKEWSLL